MSETVSGRRSLPARRGNASPREEALRYLEMLDVVRARELAAEVLVEIAATASDPRVRACLAFDLICQARRRVERILLPLRAELAAQAELAETLARAAAQGGLEAAFWQAWDEIASAAHRERRPVHPAVDRARHHIRKNYIRKLSLTDIAGVAQVSRNYLSHLFRKHCGVTVVGFIHRTRIKQAVRLMRSCDAKVTDVARRVGYSTYRDFHRNFVRLHHAPPRRFRQRHSGPGPAHGSPIPGGS